MEQYFYFFLGMVLWFFIALTTADLDSDGYGFFNNGCPKDTSIDKYLPHEKCDQFYQCYHGTLIPRFCPSGLQFNADLERCDWYQDKKCLKKREESETRSDPFEELDSNNPNHAVLICATKDSNGVMIVHENCDQFYKCSYGKPVSLKCAPELLYNPVNEKCDQAQSVECGERIIPEKETISPAMEISVRRKKHYNAQPVPSIDDIEARKSYAKLARAICSSKRSKGILLAHEYCNKYYKCKRGKAVGLKCPSNLLFNPFKERCDMPRNVNCKERITVDEKYTKYVSTRYDDNSNNSEENEISVSDDNNATLICSVANSNGALIAHEKCNQFYKCTNGSPVTLTCPGNLLFNLEKKNCDWIKNVYCGERTLDSDGNDLDSSTPRIFNGVPSEPGQVMALCTAEGSDSMLLAHKRCNQFYKCQDSRAVEKTCPGNLLYSIEKEYCDWPTFVECGERTKPDSPNSAEVDDNTIESGSGSGHSQGEPKPSQAIQATSICASKNTEGMLIPHENCNQFYKCYEGKPIPLFCQLNLFYNPLKEYCDWPHNVNCGTRVVPVNTKTNYEEEAYDSNLPCSGITNGNILPHENCSQFYKCVNGQTYPMDCPPGLYFNAILKYCDWPVNVDCGERYTEVQVNKHGVSRRALSLRMIS